MVPERMRRPANVALYGVSIDIGTLRKVTVMSVKTLGWNESSAPSTLTEPYSFTRPSNFIVARLFLSSPIEATAIAAIPKAANRLSRSAYLRCSRSGAST